MTCPSGSGNTMIHGHFAMSVLFRQHNDTRTPWNVRPVQATQWHTDTLKCPACSSNTMTHGHPAMSVLFRQQNDTQIPWYVRPVQATQWHTDTLICPACLGNILAHGHPAVTINSVKITVQAFTVYSVTRLNWPHSRREDTCMWSVHLRREWITLRGIL
jgi:hypothetical protein